MKKISKDIIDAENNLTQERIKKLLNCNYSFFNDLRPKDSFNNLMSWVRDTCGEMICKNYVENKDKLVCIINNAIGIEGTFVQYCELNSVNIVPLMIDSISSWKTETSTESFMIQGVFLIKNDSFSFIHAALFHKGNQFEDEISYFVVVNKEDYSKYINFRNEFIQWQTSRINQILEVRVFGGEDYVYTTNHKWNELFLPNELKREIKFSVDSFWNAKSKFLKNKLPWKRGILLYGLPGNGKTTIINTIMSEYNFKPVTISSSEIDDYSLTEAFKYAEENGPSFLFFEDIDVMLKDGLIDNRYFLNLLDGIKTINGVLIVATSNRPNKLPKSLSDRPSRFDRKYEISYPDPAMAFKYLRKWFKPSAVDNDCLNSIVKITVDNEFSYAYLRELYISSMFCAMADNREQPNIDDLNKSIDSLVKERRTVENDFVPKRAKKFGFSG